MAACAPGGATRESKVSDVTGEADIRRKLLLMVGVNPCQNECVCKVWGTPILTTALVTKVLPRKKKPFQKRLGSKTAKNAERLGQQGGELPDAEATTFRALAARANYPALNRPDIAYATN